MSEEGAFLLGCLAGAVVFIVIMMIIMSQLPA